MFLENLIIFQMFLFQPLEPSIFYGWNFAKFWPEKYDFNPYKGFIMKKRAQIR